MPILLKNNGNFVGTSMKNTWFSHAHGLSSDPKLALAAKIAEVRKCEVIAFWGLLLEHGSANEDRGLVEDLNFEVASFTLEIEIEVLRKIYVTLHSVTALHGGYIKNFERYNNVTSKRAMTGAERVRKYRENKKKNTEPELEKNLPCNESNDVTTHTDIQTVSKNSETKVSSSAPNPPKNQNPKVIKMPFEFIPLDWKAWALSEKGWTEEILADVWSQFRDYWRDGKGRNTKREDWTATFRNWVRKENLGQRQINGQRALSFEEQAKKNTDSAIEQARKRYAEPSGI